MSVAQKKGRKRGPKPKISNAIDECGAPKAMVESTFGKIAPECLRVESAGSIEMTVPETQENSMLANPITMPFSSQVVRRRINKANDKALSQLDLLKEYNQLQAETETEEPPKVGRKRKGPTFTPSLECIVRACKEDNQKRARVLKALEFCGQTVDINPGENNQVEEKVKEKPLFLVEKPKQKRKPRQRPSRNEAVQELAEVIDCDASLITAGVRSRSRVKKLINGAKKPEPASQLDGAISLESTKEPPKSQRTKKPKEAPPKPRHPAFLGVRHYAMMKLDTQCNPARLCRGPDKFFDLYDEKHFAAFNCKKFWQRIKDQNKDDDVQSDSDLVSNTRCQVLVNVRDAINEFAKARKQNNVKAVEDQVRNMRDWYFDSFF